MAAISKGFDRLSGIYDPLARLVYGRALVRAQTCFLRDWPKNARVLIVGGGTGWFLEEVLRVAGPASVVYVELSGKMLEKSRERIGKRIPGLLDRVKFVQGTVQDLGGEMQVDVVCTHFYLDMFEGEVLENELVALHAYVKPAGYWSVVDFRYVNSGLMRLVSRFLVGVMYIFFRKITGIQARKLSDYPAKLKEEGYQLEKQMQFYGRMIAATWLQKS